MARRLKRPPSDDPSFEALSWNWDELVEKLKNFDPEELHEFSIELSKLEPGEFTVFHAEPGSRPLPAFLVKAWHPLVLRKRSLLAQMKVASPADAKRIFDVVGAVLPPRIANEELGDAMEQIHRMYTLGCPRWQLTLRMWSAIFWAAFHTVTDTLSRVLNRA